MNIYCVSQGSQHQGQQGLEEMKRKEKVLKIKIDKKYGSN